MVSSYTLGWLVALAFAIGAAAGGSLEMLHWRKKVSTLRSEVLRQRDLLRQHQLVGDMTTNRRSQW